jgi:hypothetical protein
MVVVVDDSSALAVVGHKEPIFRMGPAVLSELAYMNGVARLGQSVSEQMENPSCLPAHSEYVDVREGAVLENPCWGSLVALLLGR